jgi:hypothetical protein
MCLLADVFYRCSFTKKHIDIMRKCAKHCRYNVLSGKNLPKMYSLTKINPLKRTSHLHNPETPRL